MPDAFQNIFRGRSIRGHSLIMLDLFLAVLTKEKLKSWERAQRGSRTSSRTSSRRQGGGNFWRNQELEDRPLGYATSLKAPESESVRAHLFMPKMDNIVITWMKMGGTTPRATLSVRSSAISSTAWEILHLSGLMKVCVPGWKCHCDSIFHRGLHDSYFKGYQGHKCTYAYSFGARSIFPGHVRHHIQVHSCPRMVSH